MKIAVVYFPGSNRYIDIINCLDFLNYKAELISADTNNLSTFDLIIISGGFSYGDLDGAGTIACQQPVAQALKTQADFGTPIIGICNGFQILTKLSLLPGQLLPNVNNKFINKLVELEVNNNSIFTNQFKKSERIKLPIAHHSGRYYYKKNTLSEKQIILKYIDNLNGSKANIAAVTNKAGNVFGLMPHPENMYSSHQGYEFGAKFFMSVLNYV